MEGAKEGEGEDDTYGLSEPYALFMQTMLYYYVIRGQIKKHHGISLVGKETPL